MTAPRIFDPAHAAPPYARDTRATARGWDPAAPVW